MRLRSAAFCAALVCCATAINVRAEQITSTCRITAVDAAAHTVTLVRKTTTGEKTGVAKVTDSVKVTIDGQSATLASLTLPLDATVVYDTAVNSVVEIRVAKTMISAGFAPTGTAPPLAIAPFDAAKAKEYQEAWAKYVGVPAEMTNSIGMKLVLIPPGEFEMGSTEVEVEKFSSRAAQERLNPFLVKIIGTNRPQHHVRLTKPFYFGAHELTVRQFRQFVDAANYQTEAEKDGKGGLEWIPALRDWKKVPGLTWRSPGFSQEDDHPVVMISWNDAIAFCKWLSGQEGKSYRLATEAEWEYACRAGTNSFWYTGDAENDVRLAANLADASFLKDLPGAATAPWNDGYAFTSPVARFQANAFGLYDMHGNVYEWLRDWFGPTFYEQSPVVDPTGPTSGDGRVIRGGGWILTPCCARSAGHGDRDAPGERTQYTGLRVACSLN